MNKHVRGISKNKVSVMSLCNKHDGNRLVEHFKYLISKGHQVEKTELPRFFSNIGSTRQEIIRELESYKSNFQESKSKGIIGRRANVLGKGIVFENLPHSMTTEEILELTRRISETLPSDMPQIYVFHNKNRAGQFYPHIHLMLGVNGDGSKVMSNDFRHSFHEKLINVMNNYTNELGYKRSVDTSGTNLSNRAIKLIRAVAKQQAINAGEKDAHQGMLKRLRSHYFWEDIIEDRIPEVEISGVKLRIYANQMINKCMIKTFKYAEDLQRRENEKHNKINNESAGKQVDELNLSNIIDLVDKLSEIDVLEHEVVASPVINKISSNIDNTAENVSVNSPKLEPIRSKTKLL